MENNKAQIDVDSEERFSVFQIAEMQFGLNVLYIKEVIKLTRITRLPNAPHYIPGIINFRGKIISVVDLALFFGLNKNASQRPEGLIVTESRSGRFALFYDRMHEFLRLKKSGLDTSSTKLPEPILPYFCGRFNNTVILLDGDKLLTDSNFFKL